MAKKEKEKKVTKTKKEKKVKEGFVKGIQKELKMVKWPTGKEIIKYTLATVIFCIILVIFFECLDMILALIKGMFN